MLLISLAYILDQNRVVQHRVWILLFNSSFVPLGCFKVVRWVPIESALIHQSQIVESLRVSLFYRFLVVLDCLSLVRSQHSHS